MAAKSIYKNIEILKEFLSDANNFDCDIKDVYTEFYRRVDVIRIIITVRAKNSFTPPLRNDWSFPFLLIEDSNFICDVGLKIKKEVEQMVFTAKEKGERDELHNYLRDLLKKDLSEEYEGEQEAEWVFI